MLRAAQLPTSTQQKVLKASVRGSRVARCVSRLFGADGDTIVGDRRVGWVVGFLGQSASWV